MSTNILVEYTDDKMNCVTVDFCHSIILQDHLETNRDD